METADKISSSCGLEVRYPFFDRRLVEFCLSIPPAQKLQQGWTRAVMRRGMAGILPEPVRWRVDKSDLSSSFFRGLFERDRETVERVVFSHEPWLSEYVDVSALRSTYLRWAADPMRQGSDALALFGAVTLTLWLETSGLGRSPGVVRSSSEEEPHAHESLGLPDVRAVGTRLGWI
jgi:asparagine synthase (glutamine-hydrolysing)